MLQRVNKAVFGAIHRLSTATYRRFGIDNYGWAVGLLLGAAIASFYLAYGAMKFAAAETNPDVANMRRMSGFIGIYFFAALAGMVLYFRNDLRKYATRHYDLGKPPSLPLSLYAWAAIVAYAVSLPFSHWPGMVDVLISGVAALFALSEPPPMELRMDKAFDTYDPPDAA